MIYKKTLEVKGQIDSIRESITQLIDNISQSENPNKKQNKISFSS